MKKLMLILLAGLILVSIFASCGEDVTTTTADIATTTATDVTTTIPPEPPLVECNHVEEIMEAKEPTTTSVGFTEGKKCSLCGKILEPQDIIPAIPVTDGFTYRINEDNASYSVIGIGNITDVNVVIPSTYNGLPVTSIGDFAFKDNDQITHVYIPDSVVYIGADAFFYCSYLTTVVIPDTVTYIDEAAFMGCRRLTDIKLPANLTSLTNDLFVGCYALESITIPDSVTSIGERAFTGTKIKSVTIPNGVTSLERAVFSDCKELTSITIPGSVTFIDSHAFGDCEKLESIIIPSGVTHISKNAFYGNEKLTVYCEATSKPEGWDDEWTGDERKNIKVKEVVWGYKEG